MSSIEKLACNLIRNTTGKTFTYEDNIITSNYDIWFMNTTFDGKEYKVVSFGNDGVIKFFKNHPLHQKNPTKIMKLFCA